VVVVDDVEVVVVVEEVEVVVVEDVEVDEEVEGDVTTLITGVSPGSIYLALTLPAFASGSQFLISSVPVP